MSHDRSSYLSGNNVRDQLHLKDLRGVDLTKQAMRINEYWGDPVVALLSTLAGVRSRQRGRLSGFGYESLLACRNFFLNNDKNENQTGNPQGSCASSGASSTCSCAHLCLWHGSSSFASSFAWSISGEFTAV